MEKKKCHIVMLSGGYDSVATLCYLLQTTDATSTIHAHHVYNVTYQHRQDRELEAVNTIVGMLKGRYRDFKFTMSKSNYWQISRNVWDLLHWAHIGSLACCAYVYDKTTDVDVSFNLGITKGCPSLVSRVPRARAIFDGAFLDLEEAKRPKLELLFLEYTKREIVERFIPVAARPFCWTCRTPVSGLYRCGECHSCLDEKQYLSGLEGITIET